MRINNNTAAFNVWTSYTENVDAMKKSMSKLSTGAIKNTDDPAGIGISERMRAQIAGTTMARQNTENAISLVQTADAWLQKINDMVSRMKALSIEAAGIMSDTDKDNVQTEFKAMQEEITRITSKYTAAAKFNGLYLFRGGNGVAVVTNDAVEGTGGGTAGTPAHYSGTSTYVASDISGGFTNLVQFGASTLNTFLRNQLGIPAATNPYVSSLNNLLSTNSAFSTAWTNTGYSVASLDARSQALYALGVGSLGSDDLLYLQRKMMDFVYAPANLPVSDSAWVAATAGSGSGGEAKKLTVQIGADLNQKVEITLKDLQFTNTSTIGTSHAYSYGTGTSLLGSTHTNVSWASVIDTNKMSVTSADVIGKIDKAIDFVANARASMGSQQKRIENSRDGLLSYEDNLRAAESKIRDVDMAAETTNFSKYQILSNASNAMLAQANQLPQSVLTLLG